ncbi:hypothetical protein [Methanocella sp. MCL-LM]|uniref:hypothetical protein n=1 Tax=Methanocella sp. MCL-LM TaxID=3412035 RepID=UPI003C72BEB0
MFTSFSKLPGSEDIYQAVWYFWVTDQAVDKLLNGGSIHSLAYTDYIFYPAGTPIIPFSMAYNQILAILLEPLLGAVLTINLLYFSSFVLSGFGAYLLVRRVTGDESASVMAGCIYTFAPYHFEHAFVGHIGSVTMQWIPFCALFLLRMVESKKWSDAAFAAFFFILVAASDMQYMVFMGTFVMLFFAYQLIIGVIKFEKKDVLAVMVFLAISLSILVPMNASSIATALSGDNFLKPGQSEAANGSVDLLNFFVPSVHHPIFGSWIKENYYNRMDATRITWERVAFIGFTVLFLIIYASICERSNTIRFWQLSALFFALMSLGPILHIFGQTSFFNYEIPMPFSILSHIIPGLDNSRTPGRFEVLTLLSITVIAGFGASRLKKNITTRRMDQIITGRLQALLPIVIMMLILFEYLSVPFITSDPAVPEFYYSLSKEQGDFAVIEIPATYDYSAGIMAEYYQTVHQKRMVGGQLARAPDSSLEFEKKTPFISEITYQRSAGDLFQQNSSLLSKSILNSHNIRYLIIHKNYLEPDGYTQINNSVSSALGIPTYSDDKIVVYRADNSDIIQPYIMQDKNWHLVENWGGTPACWMSNNATVAITSGNSTSVRLNFTAYSFEKQRTLCMSDGNITILQTTIQPSGTQISLNISLIDQAEKKLLFYTPEEPVRPIDIPPLNNSDERLISIAVANCTAKFVENLLPKENH